MKQLRTNDVTAGGPRLLVADDDSAARALLVTRLREAGIARVAEAADGAEALQLALQLRPRVALLDLEMPLLGGIDVALSLRDLQPSLRIAIHSADPHALRERGSGLGLPLFDKLDLDPLVAWADGELRRAAAAAGEPAVTLLARKAELRCSLCDHGIVSRDPPERCPSCGAAGSWAHAPWRPFARPLTGARADR